VDPVVVSAATLVGTAFATKAGEAVWGRASDFVGWIRDRFADDEDGLVGKALDRLEADATQQSVEVFASALDALVTRVPGFRAELADQVVAAGGVVVHGEMSGGVQNNASVIGSQNNTDNSKRVGVVNAGEVTIN
jgi:hypothetical protein